MAADGTLFSTSEEIKIAGLYLKDRKEWFYKPIGPPVNTEYDFVFSDHTTSKSSSDLPKNIMVNFRQPF